MPPKPAALLDLQQQRQYYFKCYRRGDADGANKMLADKQDFPNEFAHVAKLAQPVPGQWAGLRGTNYQKRVLKRLLLEEKYTQVQEDDDRGLDDEDQTSAKKKVNTVAAKLWRAGVRYVKTLGYGGKAMAGLWECKHRDGTRSHVVVKMTYRNDAESRAEMKKERQWLSLLRRAPHILQQVYIKDIRAQVGNLPARANDGPGRASRRNVGAYEDEADDNPDIIILEYMKHGSLDSLIRNWVGPPARIVLNPARNEFLWHLFDCFLVGDFDNGVHSTVPKFAVSDFGCSDCAPDIVQDEFKIWEQRLWCKWGYYTPEHFTKEWDAVDRLPTAQQEVAGRFSKATNVYQIGQIMWCCITKLHPNDPPICKKIEYNDDGGNQVSRWSWGYDVHENVRYNAIDADLRLLVAKCMFNKPSERPTLTNLQLTITPKLTNNVGNRWKNFLGNPPLPQDDPFDPTVRGGPKIDPFA